MGDDVWFLVFRIEFSMFSIDFLVFLCYYETIKT
nr:MAG TPA: hypothetical protein [Siphoviridae sp. ctEy724]